MRSMNPESRVHHLRSSRCAIAHLRFAPSGPPRNDGHQPWTDLAISTVHGVVFHFLRRRGAWKVASDGLHQYWVECLNLVQSVAVTEVARVAASLPLPRRTDRTSQKHAGEQAKADAGSAIAQGPAPLAYPLQLVLLRWGVFTESGLFGAAAAPQSSADKTDGIRMKAGAALELVQLTKTFGNVTAVNAIDLKIPAGSYCCLLGPSGCGKTSTLRMVAGHESVTSGDIIVGAKNVTDLPPPGAARP